MDSNFYKEIGKAVEHAQKYGGSLTEQNLLYVAKIANNMSLKTGCDFDTLFKEGVIAMKKAEEKYNPEQNGNFVKYAGKSIRGYMLNAINRQTSLVHIPVNHMQGFKKGQASFEDSKIKYEFIDSIDYDTLGSVENDAFADDIEAILQEGLNTLDINGRIAIEMKLHRGKYAERVPSETDPTKLVFKYNNNIQSIADELEVPVNMASKIYKNAFDKLSKYCKAASNA